MDRSLVETFVEPIHRNCVSTLKVQRTSSNTNLGVSAQVSASLPGPLSDTVGAGIQFKEHYFPRSIVWDYWAELSELNESQLTKILLLASRVGVNCIAQAPTTDAERGGNVWLVGRFQIGNRFSASVDSKRLRQSVRKCKG